MRSSFLRRLGRLEHEVFGLLSRQQFEATRPAWAELKWRTLEALGVSPATCTHLLALHKQGVVSALSRARFPFHHQAEMEAFIDDCEASWDAALAANLTPEQAAQYVDQIWAIHTALVKEGAQIETLTEAWQRRHHP